MSRVTRETGTVEDPVVMFTHKVTDSSVSGTVRESCSNPISTATGDKKDGIYMSLVCIMRVQLYSNGIPSFLTTQGINPRLGILRETSAKDLSLRLVTKISIHESTLIKRKIR